MQPAALVASAITRACVDTEDDFEASTAAESMPVSTCLALHAFPGNIQNGKRYANAVVRFFGPYLHCWQGSSAESSDYMQYAVR